MFNFCMTFIPKQDAMYIYGGMDKGGVSQQLWAYNFTTSLWKEVQLKVNYFQFFIFFILMSSSEYRKIIIARLFSQSFRELG